jgi:hypothetical protein
MDILAIWLGKLTLLALRAARGAALPGLVVEKVFPRSWPGGWPPCRSAWWQSRLASWLAAAQS